MARLPYRPKSHFFVETSGLQTSIPANAARDAFGPVAGNLVNQYRVTSKVLLASPVPTAKIYAISDGHILIQPMTGDSSKVNLILRNTNMAAFAPLRIKYFVYRGVNKSDLLTTNFIGVDYLQPVNNVDPLQPTFVKKIWQQYLNFNQPIYNAGLNPAPPDKILAAQIGYNPLFQAPDSLLDTYFNKITVPGPVEAFQLPKCNKGDHIGNFSGTIGLDIVLDNGDYQLAYENEFFKFDLNYARSTEQVFDLSLVPVAAFQQRYQEYILQFLDAAAFWGSHIGPGEVKINNGAVSADIYNDIVQKFQNRNRLYLYLHAERGRSYNYYGNYPDGNVVFELRRTPAAFAREPYATSGWPVLIKEISQASPPLVTELQFTYRLMFDADISIETSDWGFAAYNLKKNNVAPVGRDYPEIPPPGGGANLHFADLEHFTFNHVTVGANAISVANFYQYFVRASDTLPLPGYYNDLWIADLKTSLKLTVDTTGNHSHWVSRQRRMVQNILSAVFIYGGVLQTKLFIDNGKNNAGDRKARRLYIAYTASFPEDSRKEHLLVNDATSGFEKNLTADNYSQAVYNSPFFDVYRGSFTDPVEGAVTSLCLVHKKDYRLKQAFFHLGITEEEYNLLFYNNINIPNPLPDPRHIPANAANITLDLAEEPPNANDYRKFRLGLKYEVGGAPLVVYPTTDIWIYTIDNFYFFSREYAAYQEFGKSFSNNSIVHFRPLTAWRGEFGFDWVRLGDTAITGDSTAPDRRYTTIAGRYYSSVAGHANQKTNDDPPIQSGSETFRPEKEQWFGLHRNYLTFPLVQGNASKYAASWMSLFPSLNIAGTASGFPKTTTDLTAKCTVQGSVELLVNITTAPTSLKIKYPKDNLEITAATPADLTALPDVMEEGIMYRQAEIANKTITVAGTPRRIAVTVKALREFSEIRAVDVIATEAGIERQAGKLCLIPNHKSFRKVIGLSFINVKTDLNGTAVQGLSAANRPLLENEITKSLNQALIDIQLNPVTNIDFLKAANAAFYTQHTHNMSSATVPPPPVTKCFIQIPQAPPLENIPPMPHSVLESKLPAGFPVNSAIIFCVNEYLMISDDGAGNYNMLNGQAKPPLGVQQILVLGKTGAYLAPPALNEYNISGHEVAHSLGLYHSFSNFNEVGFQIFVTDNIMDYRNVGVSPVDDRTNFNAYQWEIIRSNNILRAEP